MRQTLLNGRDFAWVLWPSRQYGGRDQQQASERNGFPGGHAVPQPTYTISTTERLTRPVPLDYEDADDLLSKLRPHEDGVILKDGFRRATFLPQVWEKIPDPSEFLGNLCYKMGARDNLWRTKHLDVLIYQVEEFHE